MNTQNAFHFLKQSFNHHFNVVIICGVILIITPILWRKKILKSEKLKSWELSINTEKSWHSTVLNTINK